MRHLLILLAVILLLPLFGEAQSKVQKKPHTVESLNLRQSYKKNQAELREFQDKVVKFNDAYNNDDLSNVSLLRELIVGDMMREIEQGEKSLKALKEKKGKKATNKASLRKEAHNAAPHRVDQARMDAHDELGLSEEVNLLSFNGDAIAQTEKRIKEQQRILDVIQEFEIDKPEVLKEEMPFYKQLLTQFEHLMQVDVRDTLIQLKQETNSLVR